MVKSLEMNSSNKALMEIGVSSMKNLLIAFQNSFAQEIHSSLKPNKKFVPCCELTACHNSLSLPPSQNAGLNTNPSYLKWVVDLHYHLIVLGKSFSIIKSDGIG